MTGFTIGLARVIAGLPIESNAPVPVMIARSPAPRITISVPEPLAPGNGQEIVVEPAVPEAVMVASATGDSNDRADAACSDVALMYWTWTVW